MKTPLIHFLALLWLMPCVPLHTGDQAGTGKTGNNSTQKQQKEKECPPSTENGNKPKSTEEQENEFDHVLAGIYG